MLVGNVAQSARWAVCRTLRYVGFAPLSASLAAAMPLAARPDCAMQPVRSVLRVAHMNFAKDDRGGTRALSSMVPRRPAPPNDT